VVGKEALEKVKPGVQKGAGQTQGQERRVLQEMKACVVDRAKSKSFAGIPSGKKMGIGKRYWETHLELVQSSG